MSIKLITPSFNLLTHIVEQIPAIVVIYREKAIYVNSFTLKFSGYSKEDFRKKYIWEFFPEEYQEEIKNKLSLRLNKKVRKLEYESYPVIVKNGKVRYIKFTTTSIIISGKVYGLAVGIDVSQEKRLESQLKNYIQKIEAILKYSGDIILIIDKDGIVRYASPSIENICGIRPEEVIGKSALSNVHQDDKEKLKYTLELTFKNPGRIYSYEFRVIRKDGKLRWIEGNIYLPENWNEIGLEGAVANERDITKRKELESKIQKSMYYDILTGLPNRKFFEEKLTYIAKLVERDRKLISIILINIRRFKDINFTYGHEIGDKILLEVKKRLKRVCSDAVVISRLFADNFGIAIVLDRLEEIETVISKLKNAFEKPVRINNSAIFIKCFLGISIYPIDGKSPIEVLKKAELALSQARENKDTDVSFYSEGVEKLILEREIIKNSLLSAIKRKHIEVFYQPVFELSSMKIAGFEALSRWNHPELGIITPDRFIPIAEETGIISELGFYVLEKSIRDISTINRKLLKNFSISVNFSTKQFLDENFVSILERYCNKYNFEPSLFTVEITESTAMKNPERTGEILNKLRKYGIKIAIDDFGKGYSSMEYLIEFDIDILKIDKSFVVSITENQKALHIVSTIVNLAKNIGAISLAEGIELKEQLDILKEIGCKEGQGYFFAKPMPFTELIDFLKSIHKLS